MAHIDMFLVSLISTVIFILFCCYYYTRESFDTKRKVLFSYLKPIILTFITYLLIHFYYLISNYGNEVLLIDILLLLILLMAVIAAYLIALKNKEKDLCLIVSAIDATIVAILSWCLQNKLVNFPEEYDINKYLVLFAALVVSFTANETVKLFGSDYEAKKEAKEKLIEIIVCLTFSLFFYPLAKSIKETSGLSDIFQIDIFTSVVFAFIVANAVSYISDTVAARSEDSLKLTTDYTKLVNRFIDKKGLIKIKKENGSLYLPVVKDYDLKDKKVDLEYKDKTKYQPDSFIKGHEEELMEAHAHSDVFNSLVFRVDSWEESKDRFIINASNTTYFNSLITNRAMDYKLKNNATLRSIYQYSPFIPELNENSPLSNHLGYNGLVILNDKEEHIPFILRSRNVSIGKASWGTSIEASCKAHYVLSSDRGDENKIEYAIKMETEKELKIPKEKITSIEFISAYRDLVEGGKPQLAFIEHVNMNEKEFISSFKKTIVKDDFVPDKLVQDGKTIKTFTKKQIMNAEFYIDHIKIDGKSYNMVPSTIATILMFCQYYNNVSSNKQ